MNVFISGGAKNGKSSFAQRLAVNMAKEKNCPLYYVATMVPHDGEDRARIERHRDDRRGLGFKTIECGRDIDVEIRNRGDGVFLIDSVTALFVSDFIYADGVEYDEITDGYIRGLAIIDRALAKACGRVVEMINGIPIDYKDDRAIQEDWGIKVDKE